MVWVEKVGAEASSRAPLSPPQQEREKGEKKGKGESFREKVSYAIASYLFISRFRAARSLWKGGGKGRKKRKEERGGMVSEIARKVRGGFLPLATQEDPPGGRQGRRDEEKGAPLMDERGACILASLSTRLLVVKGKGTRGGLLFSREGALPSPLRRKPPPGEKGRKKERKRGDFIIGKKRKEGASRRCISPTLLSSSSLEDWRLGRKKKGKRGGGC